MGGGQASSTGQSGSTLNGHGHVRAISQIPRATAHNCEYDPDQALSERSLSPSLEENQSQLMGKLFNNTAEARSSLNWYVPRKIIDSLTRPHSYVCHTEFWPSNIPTLDADAGRLGISVGRFASIPVTLLEYRERLARRAVFRQLHFRPSAQSKWTRMFCIVYC